jgi:hypothetical protein
MRRNGGGRGQAKFVGADAPAEAAGVSGAYDVGRGAAFTTQFCDDPVLCGTLTYLPAVARFEVIELKVVLSCEPRELTTAMIATEIPAAISPYSMAVAPD